MSPFLHHPVILNPKLVAFKTWLSLLVVSFVALLPFFVPEQNPIVQYSGSCMTGITSSTVLYDWNFFHV